MLVINYSSSQTEMPILLEASKYKTGVTRNFSGLGGAQKKNVKIVL